MQLPLSALLSQALIAFTIEFDNEFEHQAPHRTTNFGATSASAPWLVSMAIWIKFLRFVPDQGIQVEEFQRRAALTSKETKTWLTRLSQWWGYVVIRKNAAEDPRHWLIRPTSGGQKALDIWRPLNAVMEKRWQDRFGTRTVEKLRQSVQSLANQFNPALPDSLPILGYDMLSPGPDPELHTGTKSAAEPTLPALMSKLLLAFAIRFERESGLSLAISANVLRLASEQGTRVRDLPHLSGVSKEAIAMALKRLKSSGSASRAKALSLTALAAYMREIPTIAWSRISKNAGNRASARA